MSDEIFSGAAIFSRYFSSSPLHKILYFFFALAFSVLLIRQIIHCDAVQPLFQDVTPIQIETFFQGILQHGVCVCVSLCARALTTKGEKKKKSSLLQQITESKIYPNVYSRIPSTRTRLYSWKSENRMARFYLAWHGTEHTLCTHTLIVTNFEVL